MIFPASYDLTTKIVSALVCVAALGAAVASRSIPIGAVLFFAVAMAYAYSPRGYAFSGNSITVRRLIGDVEIPLDGAREVRAATADDFRGCIRLWASGGLFGYYGLFRTSKLGKCSWYVTNRRNSVVVVTAVKTVVLSPDDPSAMLAAIGPVAPSGRFETTAPPSSRSRWPLGAIVGVILGFLALGFAFFAVTYSPGPPRYTLTADGLVIHDLLYPVTLKASGIDVARIAIVDLTADSPWRPTVRTNGFANRHYRSGWFRTANGEKVRMYRADGSRLVLLPPKGEGAPVLLEVKDPERFIEDARRLWD